jgi:hypothetical protein
VALRQTHTYTKQQIYTADKQTTEREREREREQEITKAERRGDSLKADETL